MKLLTIRNNNRLDLGVKTDKRILNVTQALSQVKGEGVPSSMEQVIQGGEGALKALKDYVSKVESENSSLFVEETSVQIGPAVPNPGKIICVGLNYRKHAEESKMPIPTVPILFSKFSNTIAGPNDVIPIPHNTQKADYEAELCIVIGKTAKRVKKEEALDYVLGYCCANDVSARDLQLKTGQWLIGKTADGFCPVGPYLVTSDEVGNPNNLSIRAIVNGEVRQDSNTADMIFYCDEIIRYVSDHMTLNPGDIILTGTPEGVILGFPEDQQVWLKDGDEVTIEIEKLGRLTNTFRQEV